MTGGVPMPDRVGSLAEVRINALSKPCCRTQQRRAVPGPRLLQAMFAFG